MEHGAEIICGALVWILLLTKIILKVMGGQEYLHFSKSRAEFSFSCNLVALLEDSGDVKTTNKIHVFSDFRGSEFKKRSGGACSRAPYPICI